MQQLFIGMEKSGIKQVGWGFLGLTMMLSGGCSSMLGDDEFGCRGVPEGVSCKSAKEVYEMTENGYIPEGNTVDGASGQESESSMMRKPLGDYITLDLDKPVPVRTPATVMRIWINTFESDDGDLIAPGYVFTEIEPRRWTIGHRHRQSPTSLQPLITGDK